MKLCQNRHLSEDYYLHIQVSDNGEGITSEDIEKIFQPFYRSSQDLHHQIAGSGIGLSLARFIVEQHSGIIWAENIVPTGTCMHVLLPLPEKPVSNPVKQTESSPLMNVQEFIPSEKKETPVISQTLLLVEDNKDVLDYLEKQFENEYKVLKAENGKEALTQIAIKIPELIVSDVMMPEMDGLTLCHKIKQNVNLNHIPVILLTAKTREEDNLEGLETGADAYMTKPFHMEILRKTAANLIRSRERLRNTYTGQQTQGDKVQPIEVQSPDDKLMERIMRVINENLSNPNLTVEMITTEVGISRVHLHRKLKELTNQTTRDFIRNIRLKQAAELLSKKRYTIAEVADLTGFTNPNNFSTAFKDLYGMPPSIYMEQHLKQDKNKEEN